MKKTLLTLGLVVIQALLATAQIQIPAELAGKVEYYYLDNGMEVVLVPNESVPVIASIVLVRTGLHNETPAINGASHFLEHLLFNGTERRTQEQLYDEVDLLGAYNNAHTDWDYTSYIMLAPKENFERALDIQSDMLFHSILPQDKFEKEKGIILEEIAKDKTRPSYAADLWFRRTLFGETMYSLPVLGAESSIRQMSRDDVWAYYLQYYVPNNMTLFIMGDFRPAEMQELVKQYFGSIPPGDGGWLVHKRPLRPEFGVETAFAVKGLPQTRLRLAYPAPAFSSPASYAMVVAARQLTSRLRQCLLERKPALATSVAVSYNYHLLAQWVEIDVTLGSQADPDQVRAKIEKEITRFARRDSADPSWAKEIQQVVRKRLVQDIFDLQQPHYFAMFRSQELALGGGAYLKHYQQAFLRVRPAEVRAVVQKYFVQQKPAVVLFQPLPEEKGPSAAGSVPRRITTRLVLGNGITLIVRQDRSNPVAGVHFLFKNRAALEPDSLKGIAELLHYVYDRGTAGLPGEAFQRKLDALGANLKLHDWGFVPYDDYYWSNSYSYIRLQCLSSALDSSLALVADLLEHPNLTAASVAVARQQLLAQVKRNSRSARYVAWNAFRKLLFGKPFGGAILGSEQTLNRINVGELKLFRRKYVRGENLIVSIVSPLPPDSAAALIRARLGTLPGKPSAGGINRVVAPSSQTRFVEKNVGGSQSYIVLGRLLPNFRLDELPALWVLNRILSDHLSFDLREVKGWAYSIGSSVSLDPAPYWAFSMGTRPENLDSAYSELLDQLKRFEKIPISQHDLRKARNQIRGSMLRRFLTRENQAYFLGVGEYLQNDYGLYFDAVGRLAAVKQADLERLRKKYFRKPEYWTVIAR